MPTGKAKLAPALYDASDSDTAVGGGDLGKRAQVFVHAYFRDSF